jgi:hypothetical protein
MNLAAFELLKKYKPQCDYCKQNEKKYEYNSQTLTYYRNKVSSNYYFCSANCKDAFKNEKRCNDCGYHSDLVQPSGETFVLCTDYPYDKSCYQKYMREKNKYGNSNYCAFCERNLEVKGKLIVNDKITIHYCEECLEIYRNIVLTLDYEPRETSNSSDQCGECVFCTGESDCKNIHGSILCDKCVDIYKLMVLGCD